MLLRRITKHVKDQNWFAVGIDFVIVVIGVFIGIQVANWNDARANSEQERAILVQLQDEFSEIELSLSKQIAIRSQYVEDLQSLIGGLEGTAPAPEHPVIQRALIAARATGRRPAQSSAYLQLTANGDLARLSNAELKNALVRYHARLQRDAFIFPELMRMVAMELSSNEFVDFDVNATVAGAAIDQDAKTPDAFGYDSIRSYDFAGLAKYEQRYETFHVMHNALMDSDKSQLELVNLILNSISNDLK